VDQEGAGSKAINMGMPRNHLQSSLSDVKKPLWWGGDRMMQFRKASRMTVHIDKWNRQLAEEEAQKHVPPAKPILRCDICPRKKIAITNEIFAE
jgi:hypothetical protein